MVHPTSADVQLSPVRLNCCTACSNTVRQEYRDRGVTFVLEALQKPAYLEELTGLAELQRRAAEADLDDMSWDSFDED